MLVAPTLDPRPAWRTLARIALTTGVLAALVPWVDAASPRVAMAQEEAPQDETSGDSDATTGRADQVYVLRRGAVTPYSGTVVRNDIDKVVLEQADGKSRDFDSASVVRVVLGRVPPAYAEGQALLSRGEPAEAAKSFARAVEDEASSDVVRASAALRAAEALFRAGAADSARFGEAAQAARRFLDAHANHREVPAAGLLEARALRCSGDAAGALERFAALHGQLQGPTPTPGYDLTIVLTAGLEGAHTALEANDAARARQTFAALESQLAGARAQVEDGDARAHELATLQVAAQLGEGHLLLAEGRATQSATFFRGHLSAASETDALRLRAGLGLGLALAAQGQHREAQIEFARYAALGVSDPDGHARALLGAAESALALADREGPDQARRWLTAIVEGDPTPSSRRAQELLRTL